MSSTSCYAPLTTLKPLSYGQCVVCLSGTAGDAGNKLAFLTLAQVSFPPFNPPPPRLPFIWPLQGSAKWQHASVVLRGGDIFRVGAHIGLTCIVGNEVCEFSLYMRSSGCGCGSKWLPVGQTSGLWKKKKKKKEQFGVGNPGRVKKTQTKGKKNRRLIVCFRSLQWNELRKGLMWGAKWRQLNFSMGLNSEIAIKRNISWQHEALTQSFSTLSLKVKIEVSHTHTHR